MVILKAALHNHPPLLQSKKKQPHIGFVILRILWKRFKNQNTRGEFATISKNELGLIVPAPFSKPPKVLFIHYNFDYYWYYDKS